MTPSHKQNLHLSAGQNAIRCRVPKARDRVGKIFWKGCVESTDLRVMQGLTEREHRALKEGFNCPEGFLDDTPLSALATAVWDSD